METNLKAPFMLIDFTHEELDAWLSEIPMKKESISSGISRD